MDKTHDIGDNLHDIGAIVKEAVEQKFRELVTGVSNAGSAGREKVTEMSDGVAEYVGERPIRSVLIAASVGFLLGQFIHRR